MESLVKSLLGKGQEHVYETMQTMIEDAEKARSMEIELQESKMMLENLKDVNEQNKKKVRDLKDDLDYERGINEELVDELKGKDDEIDHLKKCVKNRDDISTSLDDMFKEKLDEIRNLRENCDSLAKQVGKEIIIEKKLEIQNKVIHELKSNLKEAKDTKRAEPIEDIEKLLLDIKHLEEENQAKVKQLEDFQNENEIIKEKLCSLEERNNALADDGIFLSEELSLESNIVSTFECKICKKGFATKDHMKTHARIEHKETAKKLMEVKADQLKAQIDLQKLSLTENLLQLNVTESAEENMCNCKGKCKIIHKIYNWRVKFGHKLHSKFLNLNVLEKKAEVEKEPSQFQCKNCDKSFGNTDELKKHSKTLHCIETSFANPWGLNFLTVRRLQ